MRRMIALFMVFLLLCGCAPMPQSAAPCPIAGGEIVGQNDDLWILPVDAAGATRLCAGEDTLLLCSLGAEWTLCLLSQEDLSVTASTTVSAGSRAYVQMLDDYISVADPESGTVTLLSHELEPVTVLELYLPADAWFLSPDAGTLYAISGNALLSRPLATGELQTFPDRRRYSLLASTAPRALLESPYALSLLDLTDRTALFVGMGADLRASWHILDLETGVVSPAPEQYPIAASQKLQPLSDGRFLYRADQKLQLYAPDGSFLSICTLPRSDAPRAGYEFLWSERWQGYFFLDLSDQTGKLMLWIPRIQENSSPVTLSMDTAAPGTMLPRELYDRAAALSEQFCVDIRIADQCQLDYNTFHSTVFSDPKKVADALDILETALSRYPRGYLDQLKYSSILRIRIELVAELKPEADADVSKTAEAFSRERSTEYLVVFDGDDLNETNVHHELAHIADKRILLSSSLREDAFFSEAGWMALQPEGFAYADSYTSISADVEEFYDSGYFARDYACVSASEDRATMMECAIMARTDIYTANPHLTGKLRYYSACIRDCFDTTGWPEIAPWEFLLN